MPVIETRFHFSGESADIPVVRYEDTLSVTHALAKAMPTAPILEYLGFTTAQTTMGYWCSTTAEYPEGASFVEAFNRLPRDSFCGYERPALRPFEGGEYGSLDFTATFAKDNALLFDVSGFRQHHDVIVHGIAQTLYTARIFRQFHDIAQQVMSLPHALQQPAADTLAKSFDTTIATVRMYDMLTATGNYTKILQRVIGARSQGDYNIHVVEVRQRVNDLHQAITGHELPPADIDFFTWREIHQGNEHLA